MKKTKLTYMELETIANNIVAKIKRDKLEFSHMLIVTRGGLIPGYMLAARLGIKKIRTVCITSYEGTSQRMMSVLDDRGMKGRTAVYGTQSWLIVDDLSDTGDTLNFVKTNYFGPDTGNFRTATFLIKEGTKHVPDYFSYSVPKEEWIVFPYEVD